MTLRALLRQATARLFEQSAADFEDEVRRINALEGYAASRAFVPWPRAKLFTGCPEHAPYALAISLNNKLVPAAGRSSGIDAEYAALSADAESAFAAQAEYFAEAFVGGDYYATFFDPLAEVLARGLDASKRGAAFLREHVLAIDLVPYFSRDFAEPKRRDEWGAHAQGVADDLLSTLLDAHPPSVIFANGKATKAALEARGARFEHTVEVTNRSGGGTAKLNLGRLGDAPIVHSNFLRRVYGPNSAEELAATGDVLRAWNAGQVHRPQVVRGAGGSRSSGPACPYDGPGAPKGYVSRTCKGFLLSVAWQPSLYTPVRPSGARTRRRFMVAVEAKKDQPRRNAALASWTGCGTTPVEGAPPLVAAPLGANSDRVRLLLEARRAARGDGSRAANAACLRTVPSAPAEVGGRNGLSW